MILTSSMILPILVALLLGTKPPHPSGSWPAGDISVEYDVAYGLHPKQKLDVCKPSRTGAEKLPGVILVHGGGGDKANFSTMCRMLAAADVYTVSINYREQPYPVYKVFLEDVSKALVWLKSRDEVSALRIGALGGSAGGFAASMLGTFAGAAKP